MSGTRTSSVHAGGGASAGASRDGGVAAAVADCGDAGAGEVGAAGGAEGLEGRVDLAVAFAGDEWGRGE